MSDPAIVQSKKRNAFEVVTVAAARSRQLLRGCLPKTDGSPKLARRALQEVVSGAVQKVEQPTTE